MATTKTRLETYLEKDEDLRSRYYLIKDKASEIIKWSPPVDPSVPGMQPYYTDHGMGHSQRMLGILDRMTEKLDLQLIEVFPLLCSVWLHDLGMFVGRQPGESYETTRKLHHLRSVEYVKQEAQAGHLPLDQWQLPNVLDICRAHRSKVKFDEEPIIPRERLFEDGSGIVRVQLLGSLLRFADACDVHYSRAPEAIFEIHEEFIPRVSREHWKKHFRVGQVRFNWDRTCVEVPVILPEEDVERQNEQRRVAQWIRDELSAELQSVVSVFEQHGVRLFHVKISDYTRGEYLDLSHQAEKDTLGWTINSFAKESLTPQADVLIFRPILAQEEVERCYVEIPVVQKLAEEIENHNFKGNYLFYSHPRTGKTSLLAYLSTRAQKSGLSVFWFSKQSNVPTSQELLRKLSSKASLDEGTILAFDNIHEDKQILELIDGLRREKPAVTIWSASRISEFVDFRDRWNEVGQGFIEREVPGYLDHDCIMLFLDKYRRLIDQETEDLILRQQNVTAYYLVDIYRQLSANERAENRRSPKDIVAHISLDVKEDNRKTFGGLEDIERLALKIITYLDVTPRILLENLLHRSDLDKGQGVVESLLARKIVFPTTKLIFRPDRTKVEAIDIFDSFEEFIAAQMYELDTSTMIPSLLLSEADACQDELPLALLALMDKYESLSDQQRAQMKGVILAHKENPVTLWVASRLSEEDKDLLQLVDYVSGSAIQLAPITLATFGHAYSVHENHNKAIACLEKALQEEPNHAMWLHTLAHSYEAIGNLDSAAKHMKKAASQDPDCLSCLGTIYDGMDKEDEALECYRKAVKHDRENAKAWNNMSSIYARRGKLKKARECLQTALQIDPEFIWSLKGMAAVLVHLGDFEKAKEYCHKVLSVEPEDEYTWIRLAKSYDELGNNTDAIKAWEKVVELAPENADAYYALGLCHYELDEFDKAVFYYSQAIEKNQEFVEAYVNRGAVYFNAYRDPDAALKDFVRAIGIQPSHALAHVCLGNVLAHRGELTKAQRELKLAFSLDPGYEPQAHSSAREKLKRAKDMVRQIKRSYSLATQPGNESDVEQLNGIAYKLITAGLFDEATNILEIGLEKDPKFSHLYATKGLFYLRQGEIDRGRELYEQAIGMSPDDLDLQRKFHYEFGMALRLQGRFNESLKELERALNTASKYVLDAQIEMEILKAQRGDNSE